MELSKPVLLLHLLPIGNITILSIRNVSCVTPKENFEGYAATSPIRLAKDLQGKLLLIHGTADDNVHFQQTMDYAESLVQAGKQFEMQVYKDRNHSIYGGNTRYHLYTRMSNFLFDNL